MISIIKSSMRYLLLLVFLAGVSSCASSSKSKKPGKIKPGKPIPCPQKDC